MSLSRLPAYLLLLGGITGCSVPPPPPPVSGAEAVWFEGGRLLVGDGSAPVENAVFAVANGRFTVVGRRGEIEPPEGATRVDLTGKTVIPGLIDGHNHIGLVAMRDGTNRKENYTRDNLVDQLERYAYYGVAAAMSLGLEADPELAYELRDEVIPNAARFLTVGKGIAATPMAGPPTEARVGIPYGAADEAEGRRNVTELRSRGVELVKIWVDDRNGTVPGLLPNVYRAIIDEAHRRGMRVVAHVGQSSALADAKDLLRAGVDGFAHTVRDREVDDELLALIREHPEVWLSPNLPGYPTTLADVEALAETLPPGRAQEMRDEVARRPGGTDAEPSTSFQLQCGNLRRVHEAGMKVGLGTDGTGDGFGVHQEMADMVRCGLSPMEAISAATAINAELVGAGDLGMVAVGRSADFVVLDVNPLEDITNTRQIADVYLRGNPVDRAALRAKWTGSP